MQLALALLGGLCIFATLAERKLVSSPLALPLKSQAHLAPAARHLQEIQGPLPTFAVRQLQAFNSTSSSSESSSQYSSSTPTSSCTEPVDGVSVTSRVVVNGTRFGACYNNRAFRVNDYPAYFTNREENGLAVRGDEGLVVVEYTGSNETLFLWALALFDGLEMDSVICFNLVDPSSVGTPTSNLLDGEWICDVDGDGIYSSVDDIQIDCGCSAGVDAEEYYACQQYEDFTLNSSGGLIIDGVSSDGCYEINTMWTTYGYQTYFAGPVEDGVVTMFVSSYSYATTGEYSMFWSLGIYNESGANRVCFLDAEVLNTTADTVTPFSDGNWFCDLDDDGTYEGYDGAIEVQCACIDDSHTTCFENDEGISLDSSIVYDGDSIGGCYVPIANINNGAPVFSLFGDPSTVGSILMIFVRHEDTALNLDDDVWAVSRVREYDEDTQIFTLDNICLTLVVDIELPTDPFLQGKWLCLDAAGEYFSTDESDFEEVTCGCRDEASSNSTSTGVPSSTPAPMLDGMSPPSNLLYPTSRPEATAAPEHPVPSPTSLPADGSAVSTNDASKEKTEQYTPVGIIVGSSIGGAILIAGVVTIVLCRRIKSRRSVHDSCPSPAGGTRGGGRPGQICKQNATSTTPQGQSLPSVNHGRPVVPSGNEKDNNNPPLPPGYEDMVNR